MGADDMKARTPAPEGEAWRTVPVEPTEGEAVAWRYRYPNESRWHLTQDYKQAFNEVQLLYASPVVPVGVSEVLDAAAAYLKDQYGASHGLDHPVVRARILATLRPTDTGRE